MPDFVLPAEADHCPHCGRVLVEPPNCCEKMIAERAADRDWNDAQADLGKNAPFNLNG